jgi:hypothetical protein
LSDDSHTALPPWGSEEAFRAEFDALLAGPSPENRVHGAIELERRPDGAPRPSRDAIDAARADVLGALWGLGL